MTAPTVAPLAFTSSPPPVRVRRGVGMRTVVSMVVSILDLQAAGSQVISSRIEVFDGAIGAAQHAARPPADWHAPERVPEPVEGGYRAVRQRVPREDPERPIGRERARDPAHRAGDSSA